MITFLDFETATNEFSIALLKATVSCKIMTSNKGGKNEMKSTKKKIAAVSKDCLNNNSSLNDL